jgi:hypothetical protein
MPGVDFGVGCNFNSTYPFLAFLSLGVRTPVTQEICH